MSTPGDDDALSWDGDDDPTLTTGRDTRPGRPVRSAPVSADGRTANRSRDTPAPAEDEQSGLGNAALIGIGMLAATYLLFAVGWLIAGLRLQGLEGLPVPQPTLVALTLVAAIAPVVWFAAVYTLTRSARTWVRFAWLVAGVVLLVPWPFVGTGSLV